MRKLFIVGMLAMYGAAFAAAPEPPAKDANAILGRLAQSAAPDLEVDRGVERYVIAQDETQRKLREALLAQQAELAKNARKPDAARDHIFGATLAEVSIIEYSDFECPYCRNFHGIPQEVVKRLNGKANFIWRHFPLDFHNPAAQKEAEAAECAAKIGGNEGFWQYADGIFKRTVSNGRGMPAGAGNPLLLLAAELNLDAGLFQNCIDSGEGKPRIAEDQRDATGAGITGTPGVIIRNNKTGRLAIIRGAVSAEALEKRVREVLSGS